MKGIERRLKALEDATAHRGKVGFITYAEGEKTEAQAVTAWEADSGPISECSTVFLTIYEAA
jgi:hypothetical protein